MKQIIDQVSGQTVSINLVGSTATMSCNGAWLTEHISPADLSMARLAFSKRDLDGFGSFFERAERQEAA